jgi:hypothetical protein
MLDPVATCVYGIRIASTAPAMNKSALARPLTVVSWESGRQANHLIRKTDIEHIVQNI